jgi:hypothetical protein
MRDAFAVQSVADVFFDEGFTGERPVVRAEVGDRSRRFTDLARAVRWAERRADRVRVLASRSRCGLPPLTIDGD